MDVWTCMRPADLERDQQLQQWQDMLKALQAVVEVTREAISEGRASWTMRSRSSSMFVSVHREEEE